MSDALVASVEGNGVPREDPTHGPGYGLPACSQKQVEVLCEVLDYVKLSSRPL